MRASKRKELENGFPFYIKRGLKAYISGLGLSAVLLAVFSFIMTRTDIAPVIAVILAYFSAAAGTVLFGFLLGRGIGHHALLVGASVFACMYLTVTVLFFIFSGFNLSEFNYFILLVLAVASLLGGIAGVSSV